MASSQQKFGLYFLIFGSAALSISSEFLPLISNYSSYALFHLWAPSINYIVYLFPLIYGIVLLFLGGTYSAFLPKFKILYYLLFILTLNLSIFYIATIFQEHGQYLWSQIGIYVIIGSILGILISFIRILSQPLDEECANGQED